MGYTFVKQTYENNRTLIDEELLEHLSEGIYQAHERLNDIADESYVTLSIASFGVDGVKIGDGTVYTTLLEKGQIVSATSLKWEYNDGLILEKQSIYKVPQNGEPQLVINEYNTENRHLTVSASFSIDTGYKLVATGKRGEVVEDEVWIRFYNGVYFGASNKANITVADRSDILQFMIALTKSNNIEAPINAGEEQYIYYCAPKSYGTPKFIVGGIEGGFQLVSEGDFTNSSEHTETYCVYRSEQASLGNTRVTIKS